MRVSIILIGLAITFGLSTSVLAKTNRCLSDKLKAAAKYSSCILKAESKVPGAADYTKCDVQFSRKWKKAERNCCCETLDDEAAMQDWITDGVDDMVTLLVGGTVPECDGP